MGLSTTPNPAVLDALRVAVLSDDGLTLTLAGQLDADTYRRVKKVLDVYGGKWNRKAGTHTFTTDFRPHLAHLIGGGKVGADNGGKNPLDFFATPTPVIAQMIKRIWPWPQGARFLEPSAGEGAIVDALHERHGVRADCLELHPDRADAIRKRGYDVIGGDFLTFTPEQPYDYVLMNPPFTAQGDAQAYITHVEHALTCLKPGGQLVAVVPQGYVFGTYKRIQAFREFCEANAASPTHTFAPDTFRASGTSVATCLIHVTKPTAEEAVMPAPKKASRKKTQDAPDFQQMVEETRQKMTAPAKGSKKAKPAPEVTPEPTDLLAPFRTQLGELVPTLEPRQAVAVVLNDRVMYGAILSITGAAASILRMSSGWFEMPLEDCAPAALVPGTGLAVGDLVTLTMRPGLWRITRQDVDAAAYACELVSDPSETAFTPLSGARVVRRASLADTCRDLGQEPGAVAALEVTLSKDADLPFPVSEAELDAAIVEPTPAPDYETMFPVGSRVLVDDGTTGTVHSHYHDPLVTAEEGIRADGCFVTPDGWDGKPENLHDVAHVQLTAAPELPGTPVLISPADLAPGTLGLHLVPLHQTTRSACNVRNHYDPAAIEELAASIKAEGQIENATGRWTADGQVEIVAGESRRRAQLLRAEQGEMGLTLMVNIRELADVDALRISATENMRRRKMTPLEECEAMLRMQQAGALMEDLTTTFGYKTAQPVADRILVAQTLHTTGRELLDRGELSLACAMVIARAPGQDLQLTMIRDATSSWNRATAETLSKRLSQGQFLVKHAKFDAEKSELEVKRDLFDAFEPFFLDKAAALNAQTKWLEAKAERLRAKGKHAFVHVITEANFNKWGSRGPYTHSGSKGTAGLVFALNPETGAVTEESDVYLRANASSSGGEKATTARQISDSAYQEAHQLRAHALRDSMAGNTHVTLALTVWGIVLGAQPGEGRVKVAELTGLPRAGEFSKFMPQLDARTTALQAVIAPAAAKRSHHRANPAVLLELLLAMTDAELLEHLNTLVSATAYDWSIYSNRAEVRPEYALLASLTDAPQRLAKSFKLTDEWLKKYPRPDLVALAEEAGLGRALVEDCGTLKEMRARILEHADSLHAAGFVPRLVQFPAPPAPTIKAVTTAAPQGPAEPERDRALAALAQIHDGQLSYLLDASGHDHTDWDTHAEMREWAQAQINTIGEQACADWTVLHELAADATSHGTLTADLPEHPTTAAD